MSDLGEEDVCDVGFTNPTEVECTCVKLSGKRCKGTMRYDCRNKADNLAFLVCSDCKCTYVAPDLETKNG